MSNPTIETCPLCHKIFLDKGVGICLRCYHENSALKKQITDFVRDNSTATVEEIEEATGAPLKFIRYLRKHGDLVDAGGVTVYPCKKCGKLINKGEYCGDCLAELREAGRQLDELARRERIAKEHVEEHNAPRTVAHNTDSRMEAPRKKDAAASGKRKLHMHFTRDKM